MPNRQDWLLLFLGAEGGPFPCDQVRVMKGLFLLTRVQGHPAQSQYRFEAYSYGPFESGVYRDLDALQLLGLVNVRRALGSSRREYALTERGRARYEELLTVVPQHEMGPIREIKRRVTSLAFDDLLRSIYEDFPSYAVNSVARVAQAST